MDRHLKIFALCGVTLLALTACAHQPSDVDTYGAPGFFLGLVHGWTAPFALIGHIFNNEIRVYAYPNSGGWYDFGYILGIGSLGGGAASAR
jgi:hypothetical protein